MIAVWEVVGLKYPGAGYVEGTYNRFPREGKIFFSKIISKII